MLFPVGQIVAMPGALTACPPERLVECLKRHHQGDWGCVCEEEKSANNDAVRSGARLLSAYAIDPNRPTDAFDSNCLWVITEADRSVTTFLLPEEY